MAETNNGEKMIRECKHCTEEFDSALKIRVRGGYANVCIDCHDERPDPDANTPVIRGFVTGSGKMAAMQILSFNNREDAEQYGRAWNSNSGWNNRRSGGLNDVQFTKLGENIGNANHKGKS